MLDLFLAHTYGSNHIETSKRVDIDMIGNEFQCQDHQNFILFLDINSENVKV